MILALSTLIQDLNEGPALKAARDTQRPDRTVLQRKLMMRQAAIDFAHLAHHPTGVSLNIAYDRNAAQATLGTAASLVSSAMSRHAASARSAAQ